MLTKRRSVQNRLVRLFDLALDQFRQVDKLVSKPLVFLSFNSLVSTRYIGQSFIVENRGEGKECDWYRLC